MRPWLAASLAVAVIAMGSAAKAEKLTVQAGTYGDFRQLMTNEVPGGSVTLSMTVSFPDERHERYPAVVIVHTLAGYMEANEGWHADALRQSGFATLTYDSAAARRLRQGSVAGVWPSAVAEAYAAFELLAHHPRIDSRRIAIVGFSFGGEVAYLSAFERLRSAPKRGQGQFAAHVAYYPAGVYAAAAEPGAYTGAPILMLLGEKDDNLPVAKAQGYVAYAQAAGFPSPMELKVYPGAYHAWTVPSLGAADFYPQYPSTRKCPYMMLGAARPTLLIDGRQNPMDLAAWQACMNEGRGYSMGFDASTRTRSTRDVLDFLRKALQP